MMKHIISVMAASALLLLAAACEEKNVQEEFVPTLTPSAIVGPEDGLAIDLDDYVDTLTLSWTAAKWDGTSYPTNKLLFVRESGSFDEPDYVWYIPVLDTTSVGFVKNDLKAIYAAASETPKDSQVSVKWAVATSAGKKTVLSESRTFTMTMTPEPDAFVPGNVVYLAGDAVLEEGRQLVYMPASTYSWDKAVSAHYNDNAPYCKQFDYEIFTDLEGGKNFYLWSGNSTGDKDWIFSPIASSGNVADAQNYDLTIRKDADYSATVPSSGQYRIRINTTTREIYVKKINTVSLRYWAGAKDNNMTYDGNGVWHIDLSLAANCQGYKFLFKGLDGDQPHGAQYPALATPDGDIASFNPADPVWHIVPVQGGAANNAKANGTFLVPAAAKGVKVRYTLYMNDQFGTYTHCISAIP